MSEAEDRRRDLALSGGSHRCKEQSPHLLQTRT